MYVNALVAPTVQEELNLSDDQKTKVKDAIDKIPATMRELDAGVRGASPEQRQAKMIEAAKKLEAQAEETKKTIEGVLLPKQLDGSRGLHCKRRALSAFTDKEVQQDLKLSDDQVAKIKTANEGMWKKGDELWTECADSKTQAPKWQRLLADYEKQIMEILTADQKASLDKMKGREVRIATGIWSAVLPFRQAPRRDHGATVRHHSTFL